MAHLCKQQQLLKTHGAKLIYYGFYSMAEIDEEDCRNYEAKLTVKRAKAITIRNDVFNLKAFK